MGQVVLSGDTINKYSKIDSINYSNNSVYVQSVSDFKDSDVVMVIQMTGVLYDNSGYFNGFGNTGYYEFQVVQSIDSTHHAITLYHNFINQYDPGEAIQLVRVAYCQKSAVVVSTLKCLPWNGSTGGVLAMIVNDSLTLNAPIIADGAGFQGGDTTIAKNMTCLDTAISPVFPINERDSAGLKGGGIQSVTFTQMRGYQSIGNGGGGGNGYYAGGGGGGNWGPGGLGGQMYSGCDASFSFITAGIGGEISHHYIAPNDTTNSNRIFMGGGGGSSVGPDVNGTSSGGNGGGIIFIITHILNTNGNIISANGQNADTATFGAGGGGGGGFVLLSFDSIRDSMTVSINGGNGGYSKYNKSNACLGGGGGGGFLWISGKDTSKFKVSYSPGSPGGPGPDTLASQGGIGLKLNPVLNGFLFNTIKGDQTICYKDSAFITGSQPHGGTGNFKYTWLKYSHISHSYEPTGSKDTLIFLQSSSLDTTTTFRRLVSVWVNFYNGLKPMTDSGNTVTIQVNPEIINSPLLLDTPTTCYGNKPVQILGVPATGGGSGGFTYVWEYSPQQTTWDTLKGSTGISLFNTINTTSFYYRRLSVNNHCYASSDTVQLTVLPLINHLSDTTFSSQSICKGTIADSLYGTALSGGAGPGTYTYLWKYSSNPNGPWVNSGISTPGYIPGAPDTPTYYHRIVYSGPESTCKDTSNILSIIVYPVITNNSISTPIQTICQNMAPDTIYGSILEGGTGVYTYLWKNNLEDSISTQKSLNSPSVISNPGNVTYSRWGFSGPCRDTSATQTIVVQPAIQNNRIGYSDSICNQASPNTLIPIGGALQGGDGIPYQYGWIFALKGNKFTSIADSTDTTLSPGILTNSTTNTSLIYQYRRVAYSGACTDTSADTIMITVLPSISENSILSASAIACKGISIPDSLYSNPLLGGNYPYYNYQWQSMTNGTAWDTVGNGFSYVFHESVLDTTIYRRIVISSQCKDTSKTDTLFVYPPPYFAAPDTSISDTFEFSIELHGALQGSYSSGNWSTENNLIHITNPNNPTTNVDSLQLGLNTVVWNLKTCDACPVATKTYNIHLFNLTRYNGFSPGASGDNGRFIFAGLTIDNGTVAIAGTVAKLIVFNRWGTVVYQSDNYQNDWTGNNMQGQPVPDDTYYYVLSVEVNNNDHYQYKGFVVIKR